MKVSHSEAVCLDCPTAFGFEADLTREEAEDRAEMHRVEKMGHRLVTYDGIGHLKDELRGAKVISVDEDSQMVFAWFGGHGLHAYDFTGKEVNYWTIGDPTKEAATHREIHKAIEHLRIQVREMGEQ